MTHFTESTIEQAALRDALLPRLMSGEVRVKEMEKELGGKQCT
jgi:hypothetical protein